MSAVNAHPRTLAIGLVALGATLMAALSGCSLAQLTAARGSYRAHSGHATAAGYIVARGNGWNTRGLFGPMPKRHSCHLRWRHREPLPDPRCTPGAVSPHVTQPDLDQTVCHSGYSEQVRPPESLTEPAKRKIMRAYGIPARKAGEYELDHLVPLSSGGASDVRNLWPEPAADAHRHVRSSFVANDKDYAENQIAYYALCYHHARLRRLQREFAHNWTTIASGQTR